VSAPHPSITHDSEALQAALAGWYHLRRRSLPWRDDPTPYRVWVSEIMLQQTQVATVIPYFERFLAAFPDVHALARAPEEDVLALWAGLGYYRRCRHLHAAARHVVERLGGVIPDTVEGLLALPGVGRYTAAALASIAFGRPAAVLDGNVARVLARLVALALPTDRGPGQRALWGLAEALLDPLDPSSHNQAMMELGALVCAPRSPDCRTCPLAPWCAAHAMGTPERFPLKAPRTPPKPVAEVSALVRRPSDDAILVARRPVAGLLGGLWELPGGALTAGEVPEDALTRHLGARLGAAATIGPPIASVTHVFSHRHLTLDLYAASLPGARDARWAPPALSWYTDWAWLRSGGGDRALPLSRLTEKVLAAAEGAP